MKQKELTNTQWKRLKPLLPPQKPHTGRPALAHRRVINGILWILRTGAPWRDLPERFRCWSTVARCFYRWQKVGIWQHLFEAVQPTFRVLVDAVISFFQGVQPDLSRIY